MQDANPTLPVLLSIAQCTARYGWCRSKIYQLLDAGELQSVKDGGSRRIVTASCEARVRKLIEAGR